MSSLKKWVARAHALLDNTLQPPMHELNEIDWKIDVSTNKARVVEHLCAFANYAGGGYLAYGVSNNGEIKGVNQTDVQTIVNHLANLGRDAVEPALQLDHAMLDWAGAAVLLIHIPESSMKPVHRRGQQLDDSFIRSGGTTRKASRQEIGTMMLHSKTPGWEDLHASLLQSEEELTGRLDISPIFRMLSQPPPPNMEETLAWMANESFIQRHPAGGGYVTNLGAISVARRLDNFPELSRKMVRVIVYSGLNKALTRDEKEGRFGYAVGFPGLINHVTSLLPQSEVIEMALREKRSIFPEIALRELIANALIHQDFCIQGAGPLIELFDDRIEISNPGTLLPSKRLDRLIGTQPESRNEKLARAYRRYRICEERGSGLIKAGMAVELFGLPPIRFEEGPNYFKVTLFAPRTFAEMSAQERLDACYQHAVLRYLSSSSLTNKSLRERLKMPETQRSMVSVLIQEALDRGSIIAADPESKSKKFAEYIPAWARPDGPK